MKSLSLKIDDIIFEDTEKILSQTKKTRNRYINEALQSYNKIQNRIIFVEESYKVASELVKEDSLKVLQEFEKIDYVD